MRSLILVATLLATGCGGSTLSDQIADFRATASSLSSLVDSHASSATAAAQTSCTAEMADYAKFDLAEPSDKDVAQVRRLIEKVAES